MELFVVFVFFWSYVELMNKPKQAFAEQSLEIFVSKHQNNHADQNLRDLIKLVLWWRKHLHANARCCFCTDGIVSDGSKEKKPFWLQLPQVLNDSPLRLQKHCQPIIIHKHRGK